MSASGGIDRAALILARKNIDSVINIADAQDLQARGMDVGTKRYLIPKVEVVSSLDELCYDHDNVYMPAHRFIEEIAEHVMIMREEKCPEGMDPDDWRKDQLVQVTDEFFRQLTTAEPLSDHNGRRYSYGLLAREVDSQGPKSYVDVSQHLMDGTGKGLGTLRRYFTEPESETFP